MSRDRFNHVFLGFLLLSAVCAFAVPPRFGNAVRGWADGLFSPVSYPVRQLARSVNKYAGGDELPPELETKVVAATAKAEIEQLRTTVTSLTAQVAELRKINYNRELAGDVRNYSLPFKVTGADGNRDGLNIDGTSGDGLEVGMPVASGNGIVGKVFAVGPSGAQVRLITDRGFRIGAAFNRWMPDGSVVRINTDLALVEGQGRGVLKIYSVPVVQARQLREGDWVCLDNLQRDEDWPVIMSGYRIGQIQKIAQHAKSPLYADITVRPRINLMQLREVMVVTGKPTGEAAAPVVQAKPGQGPVKAMTKGRN